MEYWRKIVNNIDQVLNLGGKALDVFEYIMDHPLLILLLIASSVIIVKKI